MSRKPMILAVIVAAFLVFPVALVAQTSGNTHTGAKIATETTTILATNTTQLLGSTPPVGYRGTLGEYIPVDSTHPLPVSVASMTLTASGSITTIPGVWTTYTCSAVTVTNVSQDIASMADRIFCMVQNLSTADSIWINPGAVSAASGSGNIEILPGQYWMDYVGPAVNIPIIADSSTAATVVQGK